MDKTVKYIVYYKDARLNSEKFCTSQAYDTFEEANKIFNAIRNDEDVSECHIKKKTIILETVSE